MKHKLTLGSLFSGSGGFELGGLLCGIEPLWASEIEPFSIRVTTKRIPQMKHYGDINTLNGAELQPVDIITFGSPCTDMSIAGKRAGLGGEQSVLFYEAIRIIKEMRNKTNGQYPRYAVWENVPGTFSSNKGKDFKTVLETIISIKEQNTSVPLPEKGQWAYADIYLGDGWSVAYRTIDAQYFRVPQRRRRIFLVADFAGRCAGEVLFEQKGVSRNYTPSGSPWQRTAVDVKNCSGETGGIVNNQENVMSFEPGAVSRIGGHTDENLSGTIRASMGDNQTAVVIENHPTDSRIRLSEDNKVPTLTSRMGTGGGNVPLVMNERQYALTVGEDVANTLTGTDYKGTQCVFEPISKTLKPCPNCERGAISAVALQGSMIGREDKNGPQGDGINDDISFTLNTVDRHGVVYAIDRETFNCGQKYARNLGITENSVASTLNAQGPSAVAQPYQNINGTISAGAHPGGFNGQDALNDMLIPVMQNDETDYIVRRLTPTECARLQGFPDYWCSELGTENPSEEEISFWTKVWETHRKVVSKNKNPKTRNQILKWLKNPHSDAAEYKMWGNGVALPCVCFVLTGILLSANEK
jgi:DNA (cytosine-5)-methyltransferase 1